MGIESFIKSMCVQTAVYWGNPVDDGYGGKTFDYPVEIKVRWDYKQKQVVLPDGKEINADVQVLTPEDLEVGGFLFLGELDDLYDFSSGVTNPLDAGDAYEILTIEKVSMPKSTTQFVRTVSLSKYKV